MKYYPSGSEGKGLLWELGPGPLTPDARIMPLDKQPVLPAARWLGINWSQDQAFWSFAERSKSSRRFSNPGWCGSELCMSRAKKAVLGTEPRHAAWPRRESWWARDSLEPVRILPDGLLCSSRILGTLQVLWRQWWRKLTPACAAQDPDAQSAAVSVPSMPPRPPHWLYVPAHDSRFVCESSGLSSQNSPLSYKVSRSASQGAHQAARKPGPEISLCPQKDGCATNTKPWLSQADRLGPQATTVPGRTCFCNYATPRDPVSLMKAARLNLEKVARPSSHSCLWGILRPLLGARIPVHGHAGDWVQGLPHAERMRYHYTMCPWASGRDSAAHPSPCRPRFDGWLPGMTWFSSRATPQMRPKRRLAQGPAARPLLQPRRKSAHAGRDQKKSAGTSAHFLNLWTGRQRHLSNHSGAVVQHPLCMQKARAQAPVCLCTDVYLYSGRKTTFSIPQKSRPRSSCTQLCRQQLTLPCTWKCEPCQVWRPHRTAGLWDRDGAVVSTDTEFSVAGMHQQLCL